MIVADTDVLIDFMSGKGPGAERVAAELGTAHLATTAVTAFELRSGVRTAKRIASVEALLDALQILAFGFEEARIAAALRVRLEARGEGIGMADYLVAATCIANDGVLLTRNLRHFQRVEGLRLSVLRTG